MASDHWPVNKISVMQRLNWLKIVIIGNIAATILLTCVVSFYVILPPKKSVELNYSSEELAHYVEISKSLDWSSLTKQQQTSNQNHLRTKRQIIPNTTPGASMKLVPGGMLIETKKPGKRLVDNWVIENGFTFDSALYEITDGSSITVKRDGVYLVYAQITIFSPSKTILTYEIQAVKKFNRPLAYCTISKLDKREKETQCKTLVTATLQANDKVSVFIRKDNFTIDNYNGKTYFGVTLLQDI